ncbi:C-type lectin domain family 10 member A-like, partial [Psammomys obesus]|uniref:C-type lectin domain family 10 member A-like n=1 Tax=Psammomys obesus TaxID=48139 RepID=UPI002452AF0A
GAGGAGRVAVQSARGGDARKARRTGRESSADLSGQEGSRADTREATRTVPGGCWPVHCSAWVTVARVGSPSASVSPSAGYQGAAPRALRAKRRHRGARAARFSHPSPADSRCRRDLGSLRAAVDNSTSSTEAELQALRARAAGLQEALNSLKVEVQGHGQELQAGRGLSQKVTSLESTMKEREQVLKTGLSEVTEHVQQLGKQLKALACQLDSLKTNGSAVACCLPPWLQHGGSCYWFSQAQKSWAEADRACQLESSHLVVVNSLDEQKFIEAHKGPVAAWMGLTDQNGPWRWVDGTDFNTGFQNWRPQQPDNWHGHGLGGGEDCAHFSYDDGRWNDDVCQRPYHWVCETELGKGS